MLLDFGATRTISEGVSESYRQLLRAGMAGDRDGIRAAALSLGMIHQDAPEPHKAAVLGMFETALAPLRSDALFDFSSNETTIQLRDEGMAFAQERTFFHVPPVDTLFIQRKIGGVFLLGSRLKAMANANAMIRAKL